MPCCMSKCQSESLRSSKGYCLHLNHTVVAASAVMMITAHALPDRALDCVSVEYIIWPINKIAWGTMLGSSVWFGGPGSTVLRKYLSRELLAEVQIRNFFTFFNINTFNAAALYSSTLMLSRKALTSYTLPDGVGSAVKAVVSESSLLKYSALALVACNAFNLLVLAPKTTEALRKMLAAHQGEEESGGGKTLGEGADEETAEFRYWHRLSLGVTLVTSACLLSYGFAFGPRLVKK
eukprot:GHVN01098727.1.p1 GENE.GHVN01098727.1~~GHVN01098727.1.p1  ORF type:complete len:236 (+),score=42.68 GHVN01098727.1:93-800(+)